MKQALEKTERSQENYLSTHELTQNIEEVDHKRRTIVRKIAVGSAALACCSVIPEKWTTPIVEFGALPAHATTSGAIADILDQLEEEFAQDSDTAEDSGTDSTDTETSGGYNSSERIDRTGDIYIDGIIRSKYVSGKIGTDYGSSLNIVFSNGDELYVPNTSEDINTVEGRAYRPGGGLTYHKDVDYMEVYADLHEHPAYITVYYNS